MAKELGTKRASESTHSWHSTGVYLPGWLPPPPLLRERSLEDGQLHALGVVSDQGTLVGPRSSLELPSETVISSRRNKCPPPPQSPSFSLPLERPLLYLCLFLIDESHYIAQASSKILGSSNLTISKFQLAGVIGSTTITSLSYSVG